MAYRRDLTEDSRSGRVVHGPFPVRLGALALGLLMFPVAAVIALASLDDATLSCDRSRDHCNVEDRHLFRPRVKTFRMRDLRGVVVEVVKEKKAEKGRAFLELVDPPRRIEVKKVSLEDAAELKANVEAALADKRAKFQFVLKAPRWLLLMAAGMLAFGVALVRSALRGIGRIVMRLDDGALHVTRRVLGIARERWTVDTTGVEDVEIDWSRIKTFDLRSHHPGHPGGALQLRLRDGAFRPVTMRAYRGYHIHLRAERELRALLDLPPRDQSKRNIQEAREREYKPTPLMGGGWSAKIGLVWLGMCCGALGGLAVAGGIAAAFGWIRGSDPIDATLFIVGGGGGVVLGITLAFLLAWRARTR